MTKFQKKKLYIRLKTIITDRKKIPRVRSEIKLVDGNVLFLFLLRIVRKGRTTIDRGRLLIARQSIVRQSIARQLIAWQLTAVN